MGSPPDDPLVFEGVAVSKFIIDVYSLSVNGFFIYMYFVYDGLQGFGKEHVGYRGFFTKEGVVALVFWVSEGVADVEVMESPFRLQDVMSGEGVTLEEGFASAIGNSEKDEALVFVGEGYVALLGEEGGNEATVSVFADVFRVTEKPHNRKTPL